MKMFGTTLLLQLIVMLCIIDSLFAGFSFLEYGLKKGLKLISYTTPIYVNLWPKFLYPLHTITNTLSLFVTLAIAIERYSFMLFKKCITMYSPISIDTLLSVIHFSYNKNDSNPADLQLPNPNNLQLMECLSKNALVFICYLSFSSPFSSIFRNSWSFVTLPGT